MRQKTAGLPLIMILAVAMGLIVVAAGDAAAHGWKAPSDAAKQNNPVPSTEASVNRGSDVYKNLCASCHGETARGDGPVASQLTPTPPDLVNRAKHHPQGDFFWKISNGRAPMPGFKDQLSEQQIWDVVNYIYGLKGE